MSVLGKFFLEDLPPRWVGSLAHAYVYVWWSVEEGVLRSGVGPPHPGGDLRDPSPIAGRSRLLTGGVLVSVALKTDTVCHLEGWALSLTHTQAW